MKAYPITDNPAEQIEFKVNEGSYALVQRLKEPNPLAGGRNIKTYKTIIMNQREVLKLYQAIQEEVLNKKEASHV